MNRGRTPFRACGPFLLALLLGACGDSSRPSAAENEQLQNAADMLDSAPNALAGIDEQALGETGRGSDRNSMDEGSR
jgi:hypothetical protein